LGFPQNGSRAGIQQKAFLIPEALKLISTRSRILNQWTFSLYSPSEKREFAIGILLTVTSKELDSRDPHPD
ncbi:MAG: hypothetical protein KDD43_15445, partial [Bdellovibrionales bacterium]|nr:hypothetical protein [Bdellovibrionales bacterium]